MRLFLLLLFVAAATSLTLEGQWLLVDPKQPPITLNISSFIYRKSEIVQKAVLSSCPSLTFQLNIDQNNFWVNSETIRRSEQQCSPVQVRQAGLLEVAVGRVLAFDIQVDRLLLLDLDGEAVFTFKRAVNETAVANERKIEGIWLVSMPADDDPTYVLQASSTQISLCGGATYSYATSPPYAIKLTPTSSGSCKDGALLQNLPKITYYRKVFERIEFYDAGVELVLSGVVRPTPAKITAPLQLPQLPAVPTPLPSKGGIKESRYLMLLLQRRDLARVRVNITSTSFIFKLCNTIEFKYTLSPGKSIKLSNSTNPTMVCKVIDETVYGSILSSAATYDVDEDGSITLQDSAGKEIVTLTIQ